MHTIHNIYIYIISQDITEISQNLLLAIILIKNIQFRVTGQAFEVSVDKATIDAFARQIDLETKHQLACQI